MGKEVDQRVVEMRFDNKQFEENAKTSMSTLDKLKKSLRLDGATKGLENVDAAAKKVDMKGLSGAVETIRVKFSALEVMGVTALANITNSAINAGKRIVSALTIDPIKTGFQEYETQINAVQTILANTESKGSTIDDVNKALDELNKYADLTIYNFTEMTRNIGTFTAAGVDLETSTNAIKGIANLAAISGSTSQQASTAMYQLSQALASGTVKLMDWNSVVNAGMGGQVFQDALKETARVHGIAIDDMIESEGSFRETLKSGWLTSEVLTETLQKFTLTTEGLTEEQIKANREMLKAKGYTEEQIDEIFKLGKTATDAATKVKTFTQLWDVLKEAAQSGWAQTWKLLIGDFEQAKALFTPISESLTNIINKMSDARNKVLEGALGKSFKGLSENISGALKAVRAVAKPIKEVSKSIENVTNSVKDYGKVTDEIINGLWGNGQSRWNKLTEAGYDWAHAQNLVNEKLGDSTRHATNYKEAQESLTQSQETATETSEKLSAADARTVEMLIALSDAELRAKGFTDEQISAFRELESTSNKLGISIRELLTNVDEIDGRWLIIDSFKNAGTSLLQVFNAIKSAWQDVFPPKSIEERSESLFNIIAALHKFSEKLIMTGETAENVRRTFAGLFSILHIISTLVGGPIKIAFKIFTKILGAFGLDIWDVTAAVGDAIVKFDKWLDKTLDFTKTFEKIVPYVKKAISVIKEWKSAIKDSDFYKTGANIIQGLIEGIKNGSKDVFDAMINLGKMLLEKIKEILGIHSPSKEMRDVGTNTMQGFVDGVKNKSSDAFDAIKNVFSKILDFIKNIKWGNIIALGFAGGMLYAGKRGLDILDSLSAPFEGLGEMLKGAGDMMSGIGKDFKAKAFERKSQAILNFAKSIALLAASLFLISRIDSAKLWESVGAIAALAAVMTGMAIAIGKLGNVKNPTKQLPIVGTILAIAISMGIMAKAMKKLSGISEDQVIQTAGLFTLMIVSLMAMMVALSKLLDLPKGVGPKSIDSVSSLLLKLSTSLLIMSIVLKIIGGMSWGDLGKAGAGIAGLVGIITLLVLIGNISGKKMEQTADSLMKLSRAIAILAIVAKILAKMSWGDMLKAAVGLLGLVGIITTLILATNLANGKEAKISKMLLAMSGSMLILSVVARLISGMSWGDMLKAGVGLAGLVVIVEMLIKATNAANGKEAKIALTLLSVSFCVAILAAITAVLGMISLPNLAKGLIAVGILSVFVKNLVEATKDAQNAKGGIVALTVLMTILAASLVTLSLLDPVKLAVSLIAMGILMTITKTIIETASEMDGAKNNIITMAALLGVLSAALITLSCLDTIGVLAAATALSLTMIVLAGSMKILSDIKLDIKNILLSIAYITAIAIALKLLAPALEQLGSLSLGEIGKGLLALAGVFAVIGLSALILGTVSPFIMMLSLAVAALGVSMLAAGVGVMSFAAGLMTLSLIGPNALNNIINVVMTMSVLIPVVMKSIGLGIIEICKVLIDAVPVITQLIATIITSLCDAIIQSVPKIGETLITVVKTVCEVLLTCVPLIVETGFKIFVAFLRSIKDHIGEITETAIQIIVNFVNAIANKLPDVIQSAFNLIISFINGLANAIRNNAQRIYDAAKNLITALWDAMFTIVKNAGKDFAKLGKNIIDGLKNGIKKSLSKIKDIAKDIGSSLLNGVKSFLGIKSPSREFMKIGMYSDEGLASGLKKYAGAVVDAAKNVASGAINTIDNGLSGMSNLISDALEGDPTIRPVLDLSDIESGARQINGMFSARQAVALASSGTIGIQNGGSGYVINMTINGAQGQDVNQLADLVSERINNSIQRRNNVWR